MPKTGYTTDSTGKPSAMRAMSFVALGTAVVFGATIIAKPLWAPESPTSLDGVYLTTMFLVAAFAPKAVQKFAEIRVPSNETSSLGGARSIPAADSGSTD